MKRGAVADLIELERLAGTEDGRVLGEVAVMRVV